MTSYIYDAEGRVLRTVQRSEWTPEDHALMLAWQQVDSLTCRCGHPADQAHHPANEGRYDVELVVCQACTAEARARRQDAPDVTYPLVTYARDEESDPLPSIEEWEAYRRTARPFLGGPEAQRGPETTKEATLG